MNATPHRATGEEPDPVDLRRRMDHNRSVWARIDGTNYGLGCGWSVYVPPVCEYARPEHDRIAA